MGEINCHVCKAVSNYFLTFTFDDNGDEEEEEEEEDVDEDSTTTFPCPKKPTHARCVGPPKKKRKTVPGMEVNFYDAVLNKRSIFRAFKKAGFQLLLFKE